eukprot:9955891-Alexandrium_andersonii.AAC.1
MEQGGGGAQHPRPAHRLLPQTQPAIAPSGRVESGWAPCHVGDVNRSRRWAVRTKPGESPQGR